MTQPPSSMRPLPLVVAKASDAERSAGSARPVAARRES